MAKSSSRPPQIRVSTAHLDPTWASYLSPVPRPSPADTIASGYSSIVSYRAGPSGSSSSSSSASSADFPFPPATSSKLLAEVFSLPTPTTKFGVALFDFYDSDPAVLSFDKGDVVEIISQDPSGWWDCMVGSSWNGYGLGGEVRRGWVPSNYVKLLTHRSQAQATLFLRAAKAKREVERRRRLAA